MLEEKVLQTIKKFDMLSFNDRILIGISGGPDSVTLLNILLSFKKRYNLSFFIAHLDHMLRGRESDEDVNFVKNLAQVFGLPCEIKSSNLTKITRKEHLTLEEAARKYRYKFFLETARKFETNKIALGHNADDQVETVLMRFLRGSGLEGLMGIPPVRGKIIRPLIECSRTEIEEYCKENKIEYRVDSSNKEVVYFRNKIRLELLPLLSKSYNKNIK
ncbi:MAG: tRNA lysidine(34) synthetase TilS, partial [bacterium]